MKNNVVNGIETILIGLGLTISISDLQSILSIILLTFDILWIIAKCIIRLYHDIKNGDIDDIDDAIADAKNEMEGKK